MTEWLVRKKSRFYRWLYRTDYRRMVMRSVNDVYEATRKLFRVIFHRPFVDYPVWTSFSPGKAGQVLKKDGKGYKWVYPEGGPAK